MTFVLDIILVIIFAAFVFTAVKKGLPPHRTFPGPKYGGSFVRGLRAVNVISDAGNPVLS